MMPKSQGAGMSDERIDVLFVCTHNAGRSVVAKTLFNDRACETRTRSPSRICRNRSKRSNQSR